MYRELTPGAGGPWVKEIGLDPAGCGTRPTYQANPHLPANQKTESRAAAAWRHTKLESTVRYLGIDVDDALEIAEQTEV